MAAYTAGIRHLPGAALLSNRAAAALQLGLPGDALRDCRAALTFDPAHVKARVRAARALQARLRCAAWQRCNPLMHVCARAGARRAA